MVVGINFLKMLKLKSIYFGAVIMFILKAVFGGNFVARSLYNPSIDNTTSGCILYDKKLHIAFLLDTSSSINAYSSQQVLFQLTEFVMRISEMVELDVGLTKISVFRFINDTTLVIRDVVDHVTLQSALLQMAPQNANKQFNYTQALLYIANSFANDSAGYTKVLFLVTFTELGPSNVVKAISDVTGITVFVLHMGDKTSPVCELTPHAFFFCKTFSSVNEIAQGADELTLALAASYGCDICYPNPCQNGGNCTNLNQNTDKNCSCSGEYFGPTCNIKDLCPSDPCNAQPCITNSSGEVTCNCTKFGYHGTYCQQQYPCAEQGCQNGGTCKFNLTSIELECFCMDGYYGELCQYQDHCELSLELCKKNGTCSHNTISHLSTCHCKYPFDGATCTQCACQNGGTCNDTSCTCTVNCEGKFCQNCVPYCDVVPSLCQNQGTCTSKSILTFTCECQPQCYGDRCQHCNYCLASNPCQHNGTCESTTMSNYTCNCTEFCNGTNCENCTTYCERYPNICENGGTCQDVCNSNSTCDNYTCNCLSYCSGDNCQSCNDLNVCPSNPGICGPGKCIDTGGGGHNCTCPKDCEGDNCETCHGYCTDHPSICLNNGDCENTPSGSYQCSCQPQCDGNNCETCLGPEKDYCNSNPTTCLNNGTCYVTNGTGFFTVGCHCPVNYHGVLCEDFVDPCTSHLCNNNGTCNFNVSVGTVCICDNGFTGANCEALTSDPVNPCNSSPCQNLCQCMESCRHSLGYKCEGSQGYLGKNCEIDPPSLKCDANNIVVEISDNFLNEMVGSGKSPYITVGGQTRVDDPSCSSQSSLNGTRFITIPLPFSNCQNQIRNSAEGSTISNEIWLNFNNDRSRSGVQFDMPVPLGRFTCSYSTEYNITTSLRPVISSPVLLSGAFRYDPRIRLCNVEACQATCANGFQANAVYTVGQRIYATITTPNIEKEYVTSLDSFALSCGSWTGRNSEVISLVEIGCPTVTSYSDALSFMLTRNAQNGIICLSFRTPNMKNCNQFYIHARLVVCETSQREICPSTNISRCNSVSIFKRSISVEKIKSLLVMGPIYSIKGSRGMSHFEIEYPIEDNEDDPIGNNIELMNPIETYAILSLLSILMIVSILVTTLLLCHKKFRSNV